MSTPSVSVIVPAYNAARHVGGAVSSILASTLDDVEVVVVDDGSTDETGAILAGFGGLIRLVSQENRGVAAARNRGISEASAPMIALCDADDIVFPGHLEALLAVQRSNGGIATANSYWLFPGGIDRRKTRLTGRFPKPTDQRRAILEQNFVSTMTAFSRRTFESLGGFQKEASPAEDWDLWMRAVFAGVPIVAQPRPLALYRWTDDGLTSNRSAMDGAVLTVLRRARDLLPLTDEEAAYVDTRLDGMSPQDHLRTADDALDEGRFGDAARSFRAASALVPTDTRLARKAQLLRLAPPLVGPALRWDARRSDTRRGGRHRTR